jgi:signal peptide peptidase SppA
MNHLLPHLAQRVLNTPLALHPAKATVVMTALADRLGIRSLMHADGLPALAAEGDEYGFAEPGRNVHVGYQNVLGVAIIEIQGTLIQKLGCLNSFSGLTGYDGIRQNFLMALDDPDVKAIVFDTSSPGGECSGAFELADLIYESRGEKPIWAICDDHAYSAAYLLASSADRIIVPRTGGVGSIGIIMAHTDFSQALAGAGIKVTFVTYGDRKADGHPEIPLSDEALAAYQADVDTLGDLFCETVARNRNIAAATVRDTQAACFMGAKGVSIGLADEVAAPDAAFRALIKQISA